MSAEPMESDAVLVERRERILTLTLNRPKSANAWSEAMQASVAWELAAAQADDALTAVVITGSGHVFSAGADIQSEPGMSPLDAGTRRAAIVGQMLVAVLDFPKPLVAAVNGPAVGAGCMLALLCDAIVASDRGHFSLPEIDLGMPSPLAFTVVECVGSGALAVDLVLSGRRMTSHEAQALGLAEACPAENVAARARGGAARHRAPPAPPPRRLCDEQAMDQHGAPAKGACRAGMRQPVSRTRRAEHRNERTLIWRTKGSAKARKKRSSCPKGVGPWRG
jgi:enoyl-CoA hydratase